MSIEMKLERMKTLRGTHDQTMRCGIVKVLHGMKKIKGVTPTERFLEDEIKRLETLLHTQQMDAYVDD